MRDVLAVELPTGEHGVAPADELYNNGASNARGGCGGGSILNVDDDDAAGVVSVGEVPKPAADGASDGGSDGGMIGLNEGPEPDFNWDGLDDDVVGPVALEPARDNDNPGAGLGRDEPGEASDEPGAASDEPGEASADELNVGGAGVRGDGRAMGWRVARGRGGEVQLVPPAGVDGHLDRERGDGEALGALARRLEALGLGTRASLDVRRTCRLAPLSPADAPVNVKVLFDGFVAKFASEHLHKFISCIDSSYAATFRGYNVPFASRAGPTFSVHVLCLQELRLHVYLLSTRELTGCVDRFVSGLNSCGAGLAKGQQWTVAPHGHKLRRLVMTTRRSSGSYNARGVLRKLQAALTGTRGVKILVKGHGHDAVVATSSADTLPMHDVWLGFLHALASEGDELLADSGLDVCTQLTSDAPVSLALRRGGDWQRLMPRGVNYFTKFGLCDLVDANGTFSAAARDRHLLEVGDAPELVTIAKGINFYSSQVYALAERVHPAMQCLLQVTPDRWTQRRAAPVIDKYDEEMKANVLNAASFRGFPLRLEVKACNVLDVLRLAHTRGRETSAMRQRLLDMGHALAIYCLGGVVELANAGFHRWCVSQHRRHIAALRTVASSSFRRQHNVLYQSLVLEVVFSSALLMWDGGTNHAKRGWLRREAVMGLVSTAAGMNTGWIKAQLADDCAYIELPLDVTSPESGLPGIGSPAKWRLGTKGVMGAFVASMAFVYCMLRHVRAPYRAPCRTHTAGGGRTGWLTSAIVYFCGSCEAYNKSLPARHFARDKVALGKVPAKLCALALFVASAAEWLGRHGIKPTFAAGPLVSSLVLRHRCARASGVRAHYRDVSHACISHP